MAAETAYLPGVWWQGSGAVRVLSDRSWLRVFENRSYGDVPVMRWQRDCVAAVRWQGDRYIDWRLGPIRTIAGIEWNIWEIGWGWHMQFYPHKRKSFEAKIYLMFFTISIELLDREGWLV